MARDSVWHDRQVVAPALSAPAVPLSMIHDRGRMLRFGRHNRLFDRNVSMREPHHLSADETYALHLPPTDRSSNSA
jgi:hypothetical protein